MMQLNIVNGIYDDENVFGVKSHLIWGKQWDEAIEFIESNTTIDQSNYGTDTIGKDNSYGDTIITGDDPTFMVNNISDMAGNMDELTQEVSYDWPVTRGYTAGYRTASGAPFETYYFGFRTALYILPADKETISTGLQIGDFVNYDPGVWTQDDLNKIVASGHGISLHETVGNLINGDRALSTQQGQFGGFELGDSKNGNALTGEENYAYNGCNYAKFKDGKAISGWRVWDIEDHDNNSSTPDQVILISAGDTEGYYSDCDQVMENQSILTEYRDWSMYENDFAVKGETTILTKTKLDRWFKKYINIPNADTRHGSVVGLIFNEKNEYHKYQTLIDNYSDYWVGLTQDLFSNDNILGFISPSILSDSGSYTSVATYDSNMYNGLRPLIVLKPNVQFTKQEGEEKVISASSDERDETHHNVWNISID